MSMFLKFAVCWRQSSRGTAAADGDADPDEIGELFDPVEGSMAFGRGRRRTILLLLLTLAFGEQGLYRRQ